MCADTQCWMGLMKGGCLMALCRAQHIPTILQPKARNTYSHEPKVHEIMPDMLTCLSGNDRTVTVPKTKRSDVSVCLIVS